MTCYKNIRPSHKPKMSSWKLKLPCLMLDIWRVVQRKNCWAIAIIMWPGMISYNCACGMICQWDSTIKWLSFIPSLTSRHCPDVTWKVLKAIPTFNPIRKNSYLIIWLYVFIIDTWPSVIKMQGFLLRKKNIEYYNSWQDVLLSFHGYSKYLF